MEIEDSTFAGIIHQMRQEMVAHAALVARGEAEANPIDHGTYFTNLPQEYYLSSTIFEKERRQVFSRQWVYAGHISQLPKNGDYYVRDVGPESLIIARDMDGRLRAFLNVCRHRGSRICDADTSGNTKLFVCPYHRWTYGVDGRLKAAPGARNGRDFKFEDWKLHEAHCDTYFGAIFVYLADEAPSETVDQLLTKLTVFKDKLKDLQLERTKIAARRVYTMSCNWKTILENAGECYHCPGGHPSLVNAVNVPATYLTDDGRVNTGGKDVLFPFNDGMKTISADGDWVCRKPLGKAQVEQFSAGYQLYPNFIGASFYSDYGTIIVIEPISVNKTRMFCEWFVHEDAVEGVDYDLERLIQVWDKTNKEDVELAERNYKGLQSVRFKPGPHVMNREGIVRMVLMSYLDMMNAPAVGSGA